MKSLIWIWLPIICMACDNRSLHDSEDFKPREIHEDIEFHFDRIEVDGVEYLILEKDNNNPHEGFGFMAFRANKLVEKQDSVLAYVRSIWEMQQLLYAKIYDVSSDDSRVASEEILRKNIQNLKQEIMMLEKTKLTGKTESPDDPEND